MTMKSGKASSSRDGREPTRQRILLATLWSMQHEGYHGTGLSRILDLADAPKGSFYHHFPGGKEEAAECALRWLASEIDAFLDDLENRQASGDDMVLGLARHAGLGVGDATMSKGSLMSVLAQDVIGSSPAIAAALRQAFEGWQRRIAVGFKRQGQPDPKTLAALALAVLEGATTMARIEGRPEMVEAMIASFLRERPKKGRIGKIITDHHDTPA